MASGPCRHRRAGALHVGVRYRNAVQGTGERPWELHIVAGAVVAAGAVLAAAPLPTTAARLALIWVALAVYAWSVPDAAAALVTAGLAYLFLNSFLVHRYGELSWDGAASLAQLGLLALTAVPALGRRWLDAVRNDLALTAELSTLVSEHHSTDMEFDTEFDTESDAGSGTAADLRQPARKQENRG